MFSRKPEPDLALGEKLKIFGATYWRGIACIVVPLILLPIVLPEGKHSMWTLYTLCLMGTFWVTECIPLTVTAFLPIMIFPLTGVMSTYKTCACYIDDAVTMFLGSLILACAVEHSGLHIRLAYLTIRSIGYSHYKLLAAMCIVTTFVSMWITNTAATVMMVPILFALLQVFEDQGVLKIFNTDATGEKSASDFTTLYFCAVTYSATIGGIGTLVGTATNLAFKGLFMKQYEEAPEYLSFPLFSFFGVPLMIALKLLSYFYYIIVYFGFLRPKSVQAKNAQIPESAIIAAKKKIDEEWKKLGGLTFWELLVIILFGGAMVMFFCRSPQIFFGWGDFLEKLFNREKKFITDSALAYSVSFLMLFLPNSLKFFKNFTAKYREELPKSSIDTVIIWRKLNATMPYSFMFLLGGGFALSRAAGLTGLNDIIGETLKGLKSLPASITMLLIIIVTIFVTNFASNVAVVNVFGPISMTLAEIVKVNPLWFILGTGFASSFCFMIPVGTPGNLVVQSSAKVSTASMMKCGLGPTIISIFGLWAFIVVYAPIIWPDVKTYPKWAPQ